MISIRSVSTFSQEQRQLIKMYTHPGAGQGKWIVDILNKALELNDAVIQERQDYKKATEKTLIRFIDGIPNVTSYDFNWLARTFTVWFDNVHSQEYEMDSILEQGNN